VAFIITITTCVVAVGTASAVAPANDSFASRIGITEETPIDLSFAEATYEPNVDTDAFMAACGYDPTTNSSSGLPRTLWFDFTPTVSERLVLVGVNGLVVTGTPGAFAAPVPTCNARTFDVTAGVTYHLMAYDLFSSKATAILLLPQVPKITATLDGTATVDAATNVVTLGGTYSCTSKDPSPASYWVSGSLEQTNGRFFVSATLFGSATATCDGVTHTWTAATDPSFGGSASSGVGPFDANGQFQPGSVDVRIDTVRACNQWGCGDPSATTPPPATTVHLASVNGTPPPLPLPGPTQVTVTFDPPVLERSTNTVTLSGTSTCTGGDDAILRGRVRQIANNGIFVDAVVFADLGLCTGSVQHWTVDAMDPALTAQGPDNGFGNPDLFAAGPLAFFGEAYTCATRGACANALAVDASLTMKAVGRPWRSGARPSSLPAGVTVRFDRRAVLDATANTVTITGTISCPQQETVRIAASGADQMVGRVNVRAGASSDGSVECGTTPQSFRFDAVAKNGRLASGKAVAWAALNFQWISADGTFYQVVGVARGNVRLVGAKADK
jgi:hypothetical protein